MFQESRTLEELVLSHNSLSQAGGVELGAGLSKNRSVKRLDVSWNHLRLAGAAQFALSLKV